MEIEKYLQPIRNQFDCKGVATDTNGERFEIEFSLVQRDDGGLFFIGYLQNFDDLPKLDIENDFVQLEGQTAEGEKIKLLEGGITLFRSNFSYNDGEVEMLIVGYPARWEIGDYRPEESNLVVEIANMQMGSDLEYELAGKRYQVYKVKNYKEVLERLRYTRSVEVTSQMKTNLVQEDDIEVIMECVQDQCFMLSLIKSTVVNWTNFRVEDPTGKVTYQEFRNSITRRFNSSELIPYSYSEQTVQFMQRSYPRYIELKKDYMLRGVISRHVETKSGGFIESRGLIAAVGVEFLASRLAYLQNSLTFIDNVDFELGLAELQSRVQPILSEIYSGLESGAINGMLSKLKGFNYRGFAGRIRKLCKQFGVKLTEQEISDFVEIRNFLAHTGSYPSGNTTFYFFSKLAHIADRIILRMLSYSGEYFNIETRKISLI